MRYDDHNWTTSFWKILRRQSYFFSVQILDEFGSLVDLTTKFGDSDLHESARARTHACIGVPHLCDARSTHFQADRPSVSLRMIDK